MDLYSRRNPTANNYPDTSAAGRHYNRNLDYIEVENLNIGMDITRARVGPYTKDLPAVTIFAGPRCSGPSARLYTNGDENATGAEYRKRKLAAASGAMARFQEYKRDIQISKWIPNEHLSFVRAISVKSVMVPPGYVYESYRGDQLADEQFASLEGKYAK